MSDLVSQFVGPLIGAGIGTCLGGVGAYIAIRVDLASLIATVESMKSNTHERLALIEQSLARAHARIDGMKDRI